jgi:hypothetical protein
MKNVRFEQSLSATTTTANHARHAKKLPKPTLVFERPLSCMLQELESPKHQESAAS